MTLHISRCNSVPILTTSHLMRNEPLEHERIVVCSATRNKVSCREGMTIDNTDTTTNTDLEMIHILSALGLIAVVDQLVQC